MRARWPMAVLAVLGALAMTAVAEEPSTHTLLYYNARMALREGEPLEAAKLWLVRNAREEQTHTVSPHDPDFRSVAWAALGELGVCPDNLDPDQDGAGLWPLAIHNWVVRNMSRRALSGQLRPFDAFMVGRQQRFVAIGDVLGWSELETVRLSRGRCYRHRLIMAGYGEWPLSRLQDRQVAARLLYALLQRSRETLAPVRVNGRSVVEARLFDLNLQLAALAEREAQQRAREQEQQGRRIGLSRLSLDALRTAAATSTLDPESDAARILQECATWPLSEWMALDDSRRLFLFQHARRYRGDPAALDQTALGVLDALVAAGRGDAAARWIAELGPEHRAEIWGGDRGARLLALDDDAGFSERSVIAIHRGVSHLERGELPEALRAMAFSMRYAADSRRAEELQVLSRRWLSYVASRYEITDDLIATLRELVPRQDYNLILEDLLWRAAFHADQASFTRGVEAQQGRGALDRRLSMLTPLAAGDVGRFSRQLRTLLQQSPGEGLRFLEQLVERLEREDYAVRAMHVQTLTNARTLVDPLTRDREASARQVRMASALMARTQGILEGLGALGENASDQDRARALDPDSEVFAGSIRLAPADPLPWPFTAIEEAAPPVFSPIRLIPREWPGADGALVFGWGIEG